MAKKSRKISLLLACVLIVVLAVSVGIFTACDKDGDSTPGDYNVKFMIRENGVGEYKEYKTVLAKSGVVVLPEIQEIPGFSFRAWYIDEACKNRFDESNVTGDMTVYAFYDDKLIDLVVIDGENKNTLEGQKVRELETLAQAESAKAEARNLIFDSWYINEACTEEYTNDNEATTVYGRYAAKVVFDNGYEILKSEILNPGELVQKPTVETLVGDRIYMDLEAGLRFAKASDNVTPFEFADKINENTTIKVLWQTPRLEFIPIADSNDYQCSNTDFYSEGGAEFKEQYRNFPVISIPGKISVIEDGVAVEHNVVAFNGIGLTDAWSAKKLIVNEGIKYVTNVRRTFATSVLESIDLPQSLEILEDSISGYDSLKEVKLPENLQVIFDCFWKDVDTKAEGYDFITIPKSVNNISQVPASVKFEDGSTFSSDGKFVYDENDAKGLGKILVSASQLCVDENNSLVLPQDIQAIQVGALCDLSYDYLLLPGSFVSVSYNNDVDLYKPFYLGSRLTENFNDLTTERNFYSSKMEISAYTVVGDLEKHKNIKFDAPEFPANMNKQAFSSSNKKNYETVGDNKVVFISQIEAGNPVSINITHKNVTLGTPAKTVVIVTKVSGDVFSKEDLVAALKISKEDLGYDIKYEKETCFGVPYDYASALTSNLYLEIEYSIDTLGFTYEENEDGTLTVTGYDPSTALDMRKPNAEGELVGDPIYLAVIPREIDGKQIVAIADNAFANQDTLQQIHIANTVKTIGKGAFANASRLELVNILTGGLEEIKEDAFKYAGAIQDADSGKMIANPNLAGGALVIKLPLAQIKNIGGNAFNTPALNVFTKVEDEKSRVEFKSGIMNENIKDAEVGKFYYVNDSMTNTLMGIVKFIGIDETTVKPTYDVDYYATAAGIKNSSAQLSFGTLIGGYNNIEAVTRFNILPNSVQLYNKISMVQFSDVSKVAKNAFNYLDDAYFEVDEEGKPVYKWITHATDKKVSEAGFMSKDTLITEAKSVTSTIFENGWCLGMENNDPKLVNQIDNMIEGKGIPGFY